MQSYIITRQWNITFKAILVYFFFDTKHKLFHICLLIFVYKHLLFCELFVHFLFNPLGNNVFIINLYAPHSISVCIRFLIITAMFLKMLSYRVT